MRKPSLAGLTALALTGGTLLSAPPAQAADSAVLYVHQYSDACSDTGPGTLEQPFCSIGPAAAVVTAGQTVDVGPGAYREHLTIASSGTPDQPIVFRSSSSTGTAYLAGTTAGITIDGQHDIKIQRFQVAGATDLPALDLRNASRVTVEGGGFGVADAATSPAVRFTGVTDSSITRSFASGRPLTAGVTMDAATAGVTLRSMTITGATSYTEVDHSVGIRVAGTGNTVLNNVVNGFTGTAVAVESGATGTLVVNNHITGGAGYGIRNHGATGTAITNNTVRDRCLDGIRVDGSSNGVSVQNNLLMKNGPFGQLGCDTSNVDGVEIGVHDDAVKDTVVDYNNADHYWASSTIYAWNGTRMSLPAFRTTSGQAAHDLETYDPQDNYDSANAAAPGYQSTDRVGTARADDPAKADTGAGPVTYADRGALETIRSPLARFDTTMDLGEGSVTVDASASTPGFVPIASYTFDFGDGTTITQDTPVAAHRYAVRGERVIIVKVTGTDGRSGTAHKYASVLPRIGSVALLALADLRYVAPFSPGTALVANHAAPDAATRLDIADAGGGQVALFSPSAQRYVSASVSTSEPLSLVGTTVSTTEKFTLIRNTDGTVSLRSAVNSRYVSADAAGTAALIANRTSIGSWEKFYRVNVADADRSFKARVNGRYVTAESAGTRPLIANRTSVGPWERFDLVDLGSGKIALFARANNRFVTADGAGSKPLIANRTNAGAWEKFTLIRNSDGTVSLKAAVNSRYVSADGAGSKPLIANRTSIGLWEKFTLG